MTRGYTDVTDMPPSKLLYESLTYKLNGIFFDVHNELGRRGNEQQYADAVEERLKEQGIAYVREHVLPPAFVGERPGRNRVDFLIEGVVVVELKAKTSLSREDYAQMLRYLAALNCKLGMIVNFHQRHLVPKRVINPDAPLHVSANLQSARESVNL
jgi:GxxExxY protein